LKSFRYLRHTLFSQTLAFQSKKKITRVILTLLYMSEYQTD